MQFTLLTTVFVACMTIIVSASPIPVVEVEARAVQFLPREPAILDEVAREPEAEPICGKYTCI